MSGDGSQHPEQRLADALAAYDDGLAAGRVTPTDDPQEIVDPALLPEWNRLAAFLTLIEQAWPRSNQDADCPAELPQAAATPDKLARGQFGRFQILGTLGQGGFGIVFLAWDATLRRRVALKVPQPETLVTPEARKRFVREARAAAGLDHPNIVPVYETGNVGPVAFIAAAYCPGPTLASWLARQSRPVPVRDAAELAATLARAVEHAHERGVLHRDLKPSNILLQRPVEDASSHGVVGWVQPTGNKSISVGGLHPPYPGLTGPPCDDVVADEPAQADSDSLSDFQPRITDFSLAWIADSEGPKTLSGVPLGSPPYMAPEQAEGRLKAIGPPTDVYALGCILYELLTRRPPFRGESQVEILRKVIADDPRPLRRVRRDIPPELEAIVLKCLEKQPDRRYPSAQDLADDLDRFLSGNPTRARPPGRWEKLARAARRHPAALIILAFGMLSAGALLGGRRWFEDRLSESRQATRLLEDKVRDQVSAARRAQYVADLRQAPGYIRAHQTRNAQDVLSRHIPGPGEEDLREFARYHLWKRCNTARRTLLGHQGDVYHVEFSTPGDLLASAGKDGTVRIWDTTTWKQVRSIWASENEVNVAAFSPDGKSLATVDDGGYLKLWDIATGHCQLEKLAHTGDAVIARFTPDGKALMTTGRTDGLVRTWDRCTGALLDDLHANGFIFSPDGRTLGLVGKEGEIKLCDLSTRKPITSLSGSKGIQDAAFSHDGTKLATAAEDSLIRLWEVPSGRLAREFGGRTDGVFSVAFSADDQTIISANGDQTIRLWDVATGKERGVWLGHTAKVWTIAASPDGRTVASASMDGAIKIWDLEASGYRYEVPVMAPAAIGFNPNGPTLLTFELGPPYSVARWEVRSGKLLERTPLNLRGSYSGSRFSPDDRFLAIATEHEATTVCDLTTGHLQNLQDPSFEKVVSIEFSYDNRYLFVGVAPSNQIWDLASGRQILPLPMTVFCAAFTPSGELYCDLDHGNVGWWDMRTGRTKTIPLKPKRPFAEPTVSSDGTLSASVDPYSRRISILSADTL